MFQLDGFWLFGALVVMYLVGVFTAQWAKDKLTGVPTDLRTALSNLETAAKNDISTAKSKVVADTTSLLAKGKAVSASENAAVAAAVADPSALSPSVTVVHTDPAADRSFAS